MESGVQAWKRKLAGSLPQGLRLRLRKWERTFRFVRNAVYDGRRFLKWSTAANQPMLRSQARAHLTFDYHKLEKGLSLPERRQGFGRTVASRLVDDIQRYEQTFGKDDMSLIVRDVLAAYRDENTANGVVVEKVDAFLASSDPSPAEGRNGGAIQLTKDQLFPVNSPTASQFIMSRRSARQYTGELVSSAQIERAVKLAQRCPSVCNRQAGIVYAANQRAMIDEVLRYQNGNGGFGHLLGGVFIVCADMTRFQSVGERMQAYVDGGIFAMALLQALHAEGLGACMLNWSQEMQGDLALRRRFAIDESLVVITMIGFGHTPETLSVAVSPRDPLPIRWVEG